ncbi:hypothetical protein XBLMG947_4100 [Xanthomonas bromi]|uniref:Uncharacterized protein n=1 Tax=Xanthomonas bromi TaxID=56449 RepID=A0A1C3NSB6_9XANT|nr:hypothetical protein XBLMG947_4100 [Xanthomonas bromi]
MIERAHAHVQLTDTYDLRATLAGREVALFAGHRAPQRRLDQILSTYYTLALRPCLTSRLTNGPRSLRYSTTMPRVGRDSCKSPLLTEG